MIRVAENKKRLFAVLFTAMLCMLCLLPMSSAFAEEEAFTSWNTDEIPALLSAPGISANIPQTINSSDEIIIECNMSEEQWRNALCNSISMQNINVALTLTLPKGTTWAASMGIGRFLPDELALSELSAARRNGFQDGMTLPLIIDLAEVSFNGSTAVVTPRVRDGFSFVFAYGDGTNEYFHRLNYKLVHSNGRSIAVAVGAIFLAQRGNPILQVMSFLPTMDTNIAVLLQINTEQQ